MSSDVLICNAALQLIKHSKRITSLEQDTKEANACEEVYEELRDALLSMHNWNFGQKRAKLAQLSTAPVFGWKYAYQLPSDHLRLTAVYDNTAERGSVPYLLEGKTILADAEQLYSKYVYRVTDPNTMAPLFRVALSKLLGSRLAVTLSQSASRSDELYKQFLDQDLPTAKSSDSIQDQPQQLPESSWVTVRGGGQQDLTFNQ